MRKAVIFMLFSAFPLWVLAQELGASLYFAQLLENPRHGNNFTVTIKVDSLAVPVNAIKGNLAFNKERMEIISVSKIGSILNLWVEEPRFNNLEGTLRFQGGVPRPGFIGNGGTVLHVIFRDKSPGPTSLIWREGEVLAADGQGTNILTNLQNLDFIVEAAETISAKTSFLDKVSLTLNILVLAIFFGAALFWGGRIILKYHDKRFHKR